MLDHRQSRHRSSSPATALAASRPRPWVPFAAFLACTLLGVIDCVSAVTHGERSRLHQLRQFVPGGVAHVSTAGTLVVGLLLILLARGLRRRKSRAHKLTLVLMLGSVVFNILKGLDVEEAIVSLGLLVALLWFRQEFSAEPDPHSRKAAGAVGLLLLGASYLTGMAFIAVRQHELAHPFSWGSASLHVLEGLVGVNGPLTFAPGRRGAATADLVGDVLLGLGALTGLTITYLLLRPAEPLPHIGPADDERMRALLQRPGRTDSLGYFALRRDKSVIWSPSGKACVAYRVVSGVMLASGDPLGDPEAWPQAIQEFLELATRHAWTVGVMGCGELAGEAWVKAGLTALEIGDEAIVEVAGFSLEGRAMRNVRQAVNRVERAGYRVTVDRVSELSAEDVGELAAQAAAWRGSGTERGFSMALGRFGDRQDPDCVVVRAWQDDTLRGFLHFVPWGRDGLSLDLMRRDRDADNGINELLIVKALQSAPDLGITQVSLNFAVFRAALEHGEKLGAGPVLRAWRSTLLLASRWFQIESLYRFNAKFRPVWEPRYLCFESTGDLPRVAFAALRAEAFVVLPRFMRRTHAA